MDDAYISIIAGIMLILVAYIMGCGNTTPVTQQDLDDNRTMMERVCYTPKVSCYGGSIFVRGAEPAIIVDDHVIRFQPEEFLRSINPRDIASIEVITDMARLTRWPIKQKSAIHFKTKR
jgi:hypothetical protein